MALDAGQNVLTISECKIAEVETNTSSAYDIGVRKAFPELKTLDVTVISQTLDAEAGLTLVDSTTIKKGYDVKAESVNIPLDILALMNGSALVPTGSTPNQVNSIVEKASDVPVQFNLAFKTDLVNGDAADFHMELYCVKGLLDVLVKADNYWTCSFTGKAYARKSDQAFRKITTNETAQTIAQMDEDEYGS